MTGWGDSGMADLCTKCFADVHLIKLVLPLRELKSRSMISKKEVISKK